MEYPKYIIGLKELNSEITNNYQKNILLVFTAVWCGPCQKLKSELVNTNQDGSRSGIQVEYQMI
jgi:thiol:disulfide interchange protein